jgi:predicted nuclease of predicted toxin-antitoxin system
MTHLKVDENLPPDVADILRDEGHDALTVAEQSLRGVDDEELFEIVNREGRGILTTDVGFADITRKPPADTPGIVVLRLRKQSMAAVRSVVHRLARVLDEGAIRGKLWIVEHDRIRVHD